jgi:O-antigen/teichoic acid export membrane protein
MKKIINIGSGQIRVVANALVGLYMTRLIITELGHDRYASLAVLLSFATIFTLFGNAVKDASVRFISKSAATDNWNEAGDFIINAIAVATWISLISILGSSLAGCINPHLIGSLPIQFVFILLTGMCMTFLSGIFLAGNFYNENFLSSSILAACGRIVYAAVAYFCISNLKIDYWGIAVANLISALFVVAGAYILFRKNLPLVSMKPRRLALSTQKQIVSFIGWMLLVYCGSYCASSAILLIANNYATSGEIVKLALGLQVGSIAAQILTCFSLVTSPGIYKALANGDKILASRYIQLLLDLLIPSAVCGMLIVNFGGEQLLRLWLGDSVPPGMIPVILGSFMSFSMVSLTIPFCAYYAASKRIKPYGLACVAESLVICMASFLVFTLQSPSGDRVSWVVLFPAGAIGLKLMFLCVIKYQGLQVNWTRTAKTILHSGLIALGAFLLLCISETKELWLIMAILTIPYLLFLYKQLVQGSPSQS